MSTAVDTMYDSSGRSAETKPAPSRIPTASTTRPANSQESSVRWSGRVLLVLPDDWRSPGPGAERAGGSPGRSGCVIC